MRDAFQHPSSLANGPYKREAASEEKTFLLLTFAAPTTSESQEQALTAGVVLKRHAAGNRYRAAVLGNQLAMLEI